ncbi:Succinate-semialdehyde dehydrogenase (acetylating) [Morus notabilis]|uniref:Succinate-semialdehyde dehydrogenase (Acetylating) n=1 Tax=Morus notabilis TaxID=981085 RepID=W9R9Y7_9ROSA|nr:Succinate-semialdehyde dehydrogenase (acetylating) [Morus notabilis]
MANFGTGAEDKTRGTGSTFQERSLRFLIGSHVVGAFIMPCGSCSFCSKGHDDLCEDFFAYRSKGILYDGETMLFLPSSATNIHVLYCMGGLAEFCVVPAHGLTLLPDSLPYAESVILGRAVFTAYGAMARAAEVRPRDSVPEVGTGGVGSRYKFEDTNKAFGDLNEGAIVGRAVVEIM